MQVEQGAYFARWRKHGDQLWLEVDGTLYPFSSDEEVNRLAVQPRGEVLLWRKRRLLLMLLTLPLSLWFYSHILGGFRFAVTLPHDHQVILVSGLGDWLRHTRNLTRPMRTRAPSHQLLRVNSR